MTFLNCGQVDNLGEPISLKTIKDRFRISKKNGDYHGISDLYHETLLFFAINIESPILKDQCWYTLSLYTMEYWSVNEECLVFMNNQ